MDKEKFERLIRITKEGKDVGHNPHYVAFGCMTAMLDMTTEQYAELNKLCQGD